MRRSLVLAGLLAGGSALAQPTEAPPPDAPPAEAPPAEAPPPEPPPPEAAATEELASDVDELFAKQEELERAERRNAATRAQVTTLLPLRRFITVFVDVGAFAVAGDGSGIRSDIGHIYFPQYIDQVPGEWVFMGDPLSTAINSLGEPSDTSNSRSITRDTINSEGRPSLLVNAIGLDIEKAVRRDISLTVLAQLLPRPDHNILDIQLAHVTYRPWAETDFTLDVGKVDSVLGVEYRTQDPRYRLGITPSLICRYTCGRPLGLRAQLKRPGVDLSAAVTNGNSFQELFEPDSKRIRSAVPTGSAHAQIADGTGDHRVQVGVSGAIGPQDGQTDHDVLQWHVGVDLQLVVDGWMLTAEYVKGRQQGDSGPMMRCDVAACLHYSGAYVLAERKVVSWFAPYARVDWRNAVHRKDAEFVYESHVWRATLGMHFEATSRIIGKLEYTFNREMGGIPQFPDDILTTSIVVATD